MNRLLLVIAARCLAVARYDADLAARRAAQAASPRGELLCECHDGRNVYGYNPARVLAWLRDGGLIDEGAAFLSSSGSTLRTG